MDANHSQPAGMSLLRFIIGAMPLRFLYIISDIGFVIIYHIVRYRRRIVRKNLASSFPEKDEKELRTIERKFYRWFADYFVETLKLLNITTEELHRRIKFIGIDKVEECFQKGQDCGGLLGHYCNWEWLSCTTIGMVEGRKLGLIYKPLRSKWFDSLFKTLRSSQPDAIIVAKQDILRVLIGLRRSGTRSLFGYIADQGPRYVNTHLWIDFLNHDTGVFTGAERIMRKMGNAVFYVSMSRPRRGYYNVTFHLISLDASKEEEGTITRRFFKMLEHDIRLNPQFYLWTHNRWKRTHAEFDKHYKTENGKVLPK